MGKDIGHVVVEESLQMLLSADGRPSGIALARYESHDAAADALAAFGVGRRFCQEHGERLVMLRPLRTIERGEMEKSLAGTHTRLIPFPCDRAALGKLRSGGARSNMMTATSSDWVCPACFYNVRAHKLTCPKCSVKKPHADAVPTSVSAMLGAKPGDWICPQCQDLVFAKKVGVSEVWRTKANTWSVGEEIQQRQ